MSARPPLLACLLTLVAALLGGAEETTGVFPIIEADGHPVVSVSLTFALHGPALPDARAVRAAGGALPSDSRQRLPEDLVEAQNEAIKAARLEDVLALYDEQSRPEAAKQFAKVANLAVDRKGSAIGFFSRQFYGDFVVLQDVIETTTYGKVPWIDIARMRDGAYALCTVLPRAGFATTMFSAALQARAGALEPLAGALPTAQKSDDGDVVRMTDIIDAVFDSETRAFTYRRHKDPIADAASLRLQMAVWVTAAIFRRPFDASTDQAADPFAQAISAAYQEALRRQALRLAFSDESDTPSTPPRARGVSVTLEDARSIRGYLATDFGRIYLCGEDGSISKFIFVAKKDAAASPTVVANPFGGKSALFKLFGSDNGMRSCLAVVCSDALAAK